MGGDSDMDGQELSEALVELGWTHGEFAERADVDPDTVTGWVHGRHRIPGTARNYVRLLVAMRRVVG